MSNDLTCKETLNVDEPTTNPVLRTMPQTATTGRTAIPATQIPQQGPLQIPAHFLTQTTLSAASSPNSAARLPTATAATALTNNQSANLNTVNHALLQQQLLNQMDPSSAQTFFRDLLALQNQNQSRIVQNVTRPPPSKTATPGVVVNTNQIQRPQPSVTPSITGLPRATFTPTLQQNQYEQQYQQILQQASQLAREKEQQRLQAEAKAAVEKQKFDEHQRAMKAKLEMERVRERQNQTNANAAFVNGISRPQIAPQPNRPVAPETPSALQQAQVVQAQAQAAQQAQQTQQAQQVIQQALLSQIFGGMSALSTLDQARAFHKQITSNLGSAYQQPSPPVQNSQQSIATSQLLSQMGGQSQLNMAASHALSQTVQNALQQASNIISQPTTSYQQPVLPTSSSTLFSSQQMTPHVTPTNNLFHGPTSSPRPQPSILRRGNAGPSPGVKRRLDDSRPASGNGTATPPTEISKAHRVLHLNDENRDSPLDENGDSPTKKRNRKQTFETEGQDAVKMFQQANSAPKIQQPKRRGRPPRTDESQKVQSVYLDLDMASAVTSTKPRSHHKKKGHDETNDSNRLTVPSQGPLIVHSPQTAMESTSAKASPREEKLKEKSRKDHSEEPDLSGLEEGVAGAVRALVGIRRRKAKQLANRNSAWKTIMRLYRGPSGTYKEKTREKIEDEVQRAKQSLDQIIIKDSLELLDDPFLGHYFIIDHSQPIEYDEKLKYLLIQNSNFVSEKGKKRLKKYLRKCFDGGMKEMTEEAGRRGVFDYEQMIGPGDDCFEKKTAPKRSKAQNKYSYHNLDPFQAIAVTLRQAEADFIQSFTQCQELLRKPRKTGKESDKRKKHEEDQKPDFSKFLLPIRIPGDGVVDGEKKSSIPDSRISRTVHEAIDCMLETLGDEEKPQLERSKRDETIEQKEKRRSLRSLLMWAQVEFKEQMYSKKDLLEKADCTCPADALECSFEDLQACPSCSCLIKSKTQPKVEEWEISKDIIAHGDLRKDSIQRWSKQFSTILQEFETILQDFHPSWYRRIEEERLMDYDPEDSVEMQEWKKQRRFETFICGFVYELPQKPSELNDSCNDCPTPWHVNRAMGPLSPFWKGPVPSSLNGTAQNGPLNKEIDPDWKPLRWPNAVIEEDIAPLDSYDKYRLEMAQEEVNRWTEQIDDIINKFSTKENWLGTLRRSSIEENGVSKLNLSFSSLPSTSATPEISNSRRKLAFSNSLRKSTSSSFGSNECLTGNFDDLDFTQDHKNNCQTSSPIAKEIHEIVKKHVEFIKEPLAGYVQQMEPAIDLLQQNLQIYNNDLWQNGEILDDFDLFDDLDDNHSSGQCSDDL